MAGVIRERVMSDASQLASHQSLECSLTAPALNFNNSFCCYESIALPLSQHNCHSCCPDAAFRAPCQIKQVKGLHFQ